MAKHPQVKLSPSFVESIPSMLVSSIVILSNVHLFRRALITDFKVVYSKEELIDVL